MKNLGTQWTIEISCSNQKAAPMEIEKIKIMGAVLQLPGKKHCQFSQFGPFSRLNWQCCLVGTVKLAIKELLNKEQIDFKELCTDYQLFYTINLLLNKELLPI